jgi:hypothetical protein
MMLEPKYDEIGYWSEIKLDIIKDYAAAYSRILSSQKKPSLYHIYIDAFAGAGKHISKKTGTSVLGSPMNALLVKPPYREYHFIDLDKQKISSLEEIAGSRQDVRIYHGDCNHVLWKKPEGVSAAQIDRMNRFWGDESWRQEAYVPSPQIKLFGETEELKTSNEVIAEAFRKRLEKLAGFRSVPEPIAMRNTQNAVVYYLFFASHKPVAEGIVKDIFKKYKNRRG